VIFAIDFDGTIVEHAYPKIGKMRNFADVIINKIKSNGHKIIIWTCRHTKETLEEMIEFLKVNKIQYDTINENIEGIGFYPEPKVYADIYIDDRNLGGIPKWLDIYEQLKFDYPYQFS
jgi:hypothetical protein